MLIDGKEWKLVPVEPTEKMIMAGVNSPMDERTEFLFRKGRTSAYRAMLATAPMPPIKRNSKRAGRPAKLQGEKAEQALKALAAGGKMACIAHDFGVSIPTLRNLRDGVAPYDKIGTGQSLSKPEPTEGKGKP